MVGGGAAGLGALAMLPSVSAFSINSDNPLSFNNPDQSGTEFEVNPSGDITSLNSINTGSPIQFQDQIQPQNDIKDDQDVTVYDRSKKQVGDGTTQANHQSINTRDLIGGDTPVVDIRDHGADISNSDNTDEIESALNHAMSIGSPLFIPPGTYEIEPGRDDAFTVDTAETTIVGSGRASQIHNKYTGNGGGNGGTFVITADDVEISSLYLRGEQEDGTSNSNQSGSHVAVYTCTGVSVHDLLCHDGSNAVLVSTDADGVEISNIQSINNEHTLLIDNCEDVVVSNVTGRAPGWQQRGIFLKKCQNVEISNVELEGMEKVGVLVQTAGDGTELKNVNLRNVGLHAGATGNRGIELSGEGDAIRNFTLDGVSIFGFTNAIVSHTRNNDNWLLEDATFRDVNGDATDNAIQINHPGTVEDLTIDDVKLTGGCIRLNPQSPDSFERVTVRDSYIETGSRNHIFGGVDGSGNSGLNDLTIADTTLITNSDNSAAVIVDADSGADNHENVLILRSKIENIGTDEGLYFWYVDHGVVRGCELIGSFDLRLSTLTEFEFSKNSGTPESGTVGEIDYAAANEDYVTKNSGQTFASDGDTIFHGLDKQPNLGDCHIHSESANSAKFSAVGGNELTITLIDPSGSSVGSDETLYWSAESPDSI